MALGWPWSGFGVALVWPWCGLGVALVWLWCGFVLRSLCLVYAYYMALRWLWVASGGFARPLASISTFCFCQNVASGGFPTGFPALAEFRDSAPGQPPWKLAGNRRAVLLILLS